MQTIPYTFNPKFLNNIGIVSKEIIRFANWTNHQSDHEFNPFKSIALIHNSWYAFKKFFTNNLKFKEFNKINLIFNF